MADNNKDNEIEKDDFLGNISSPENNVETEHSAGFEEENLVDDDIPDEPSPDVGNVDQETLDELDAFFSAMEGAGPSASPENVNLQEELAAEDRNEDEALEEYQENVEAAKEDAQSKAMESSTVESQPLDIESTIPVFTRGDSPDFGLEQNEPEVVAEDLFSEEPEAAEPEAAEPEAAEPEAVEPEAVEPEAVEPEAVEPEAVEPEAAEPETAEPEAVEPEAAEPEAVEPETAEPEAVEPETAEPEVASSPVGGQKAQNQDLPFDNGYESPTVVEYQRYMLATQELALPENEDTFNAFVQILADKIGLDPETATADDLIKIDAKFAQHNLKLLEEVAPEVVESSNQKIRDNYDAWEIMTDAGIDVANSEIPMGFMEDVQVMAAFDDQFPDENRPSLKERISDMKDDLVDVLKNDNVKLGLATLSFGLAVSAGAVTLPLAGAMYTAKLMENGTVQSFANNVHSKISSALVSLGFKEEEVNEREQLLGDKLKAVSDSKWGKVAKFGLAAGLVGFGVHSLMQATDFSFDKIPDYYASAKEGIANVGASASEYASKVFSGDYIPGEDVYASVKDTINNYIEEGKIPGEEAFEKVKNALGMHDYDIEQVSIPETSSVEDAVVDHYVSMYGNGHPSAEQTQALMDQARELNENFDNLKPGDTINLPDDLQDVFDMAVGPSDYTMGVDENIFEAASKHFEEKIGVKPDQEQLEALVNHLVNTVDDPANLAEGQVIEFPDLQPYKEMAYAGPTPEFDPISNPAFSGSEIHDKVHAMYGDYAVTKDTNAWSLAEKHYEALTGQKPSDQQIVAMINDIGLKDPNVIPENTIIHFDPDVSKYDGVTSIKESEAGWLDKSYQDYGELHHGGGPANVGDKYDINNIAKGVDRSVLSELNKDIDLDNLMPGDKVNIPGPEGQASVYEVPDVDDAVVASVYPKGVPMFMDKDKLFDMIEQANPDVDMDTGVLGFFGNDNLGADLARQGSLNVPDIDLDALNPQVTGEVPIRGFGGPGGVNRAILKAAFPDGVPELLDRSEFVDMVKEANPGLKFMDHREHFDMKIEIPNVGPTIIPEASPIADAGATVSGDASESAKRSFLDRVMGRENEHSMG